VKSKTSLNGKWDFNFNGKASKINVPGNWYTEGHDIFGEAVYSREFRLKVIKGRYYFLKFSGVDYFAEVFINGKFAGRHEGYFQPFEFDITGIVKNGINIIKVRVNSPREDKSVWPDKKYLIKGIFNHHDARPGSWDKEHGQDMNTGGIWNSVSVEERGLISFSRVKITPYLKDDGVWNFGTEVKLVYRGTCPVKAKITQSYQGHNFTSKAVGLERQALIYPGENTVLLHSDVRQPRLWYSHDMGRPDMYAFKLMVKTEDGEADSYSDTAALRQFKLSEDKFWMLNGKRIYLRGSNIIPTQWLSKYTKEIIDRDIALIKGASLNIIRIHAHVNREELYRALDEAGIMVWQDFALQWGYETTATFMENACAQIKDMVNAHYNRASIVIWCCHNEPFVNERQLDPVLFRVATGEDPVRHVMQMSDFKQHHYQGWYYDDNFINAAGTFENAKKGMVISEYGAQALPCMANMKKMFSDGGMWPPDWKKWAFHDFQHKTTFDIAGIKEPETIEEFIEVSQQFQADMIKEQTETFRLNRYTIGNGILHFMMTECWPSITWAVIDSDRVPKKGYFALKKAMQPLLPGFRLFTSRVKQGDEVGWGILWKMLYVINDLQKGFQSLKLRITISGPDNKPYFKKTSPKFDIKPDSLTYPFEDGMVFESFENDSFKIPVNAKPGIHVIITELIDHKGRILAANDARVTVIKRPEGI